MTPAPAVVLAWVWTVAIVAGGVFLALVLAVQP